MSVLDEERQTNRVTISFAVCSKCTAKCALNSEAQLRKFRTEEEVKKWVKHLQTIEIFDDAEMPNKGSVLLPKYRFNSPPFFGCIVGVVGKSVDAVDFIVWTKGDFEEGNVRKAICARVGFDYPYTIEYAAPRYSAFLRQLDAPVLGLANWMAPIQVAIWYSFARQIEVERELRAFFEFLYRYGKKIEEDTEFILHKQALGKLSADIDYSTERTLVWYDLPEHVEKIVEFERFNGLITKPETEMKKEIKRIYKMGQRVNAFYSMFGQKGSLAKLSTFAAKTRDRSKIVERLLTFKEENKLKGWGSKTLCCVLQQAFRNPLAYPIDSLIRRVSQTAFGMKGDGEKIWKQALNHFNYPALVEGILYGNAQRRILVCGEDGERGCDICRLKTESCPRHSPQDYKQS